MIQAHSIRFEHRLNPVGIDVTKPRMTWEVSGDGRHVLQEGYRVQISRHVDFSDFVWDTGKVCPGSSSHAVYQGDALQSCTRYYARVRVWDGGGIPSDWSEPSFFETAFVHPNAWTGQWILADDTLDAEPCHYLRRPFHSYGSVKSARIYATALGLYELHLNGSKVGDWLLTPGWTSYDNQLQYQTYDVTDRVRDGENAVGIILANGWYSGDLGWDGEKQLYGDRRAALVQLHLEYEDGSVQVICSDGEWKASTGPILSSEIYHGETYDARLEEPEWCMPGFMDSHWVPVGSLDHSMKMLVAQINHPTRVTEDIVPCAILRTPAGDTIIDLGQNMVGWMKFRINATAGTVIQLQHAEVLDKEGNFYTDNIRAARQTITYVCRGGIEEAFEPHFTFQGFRYVKVSGYAGELSLIDFVGRVVHTDFEFAGTFECSDPLVNQLQRNIVWGQRGNFVDVPTDCPQRDERLGWTGDAQVFIRTSTFNGNVAPFFTKWLRDLKFDQLPDGGVPAVIPAVPSQVPSFLNTGHSSSAWADAAVICPWELYTVYGDERILETQYDSMKAWVEYIRRQGDDELLWDTGFHYGDWLALDAHEGSYEGATPTDLIATAFYAYSTDLLTRSAEIIGRSADAQIYRHLHTAIVARFRQKFVTSGGGMTAETQTAHVLPLMFGLVEGSQRTRIAQTLAKMIEDNGYRLTTGFVGTPYLCHVLTDNGNHETACRLVTQQAYPSWLYAITQGATTIWEHWDGIKPDGSFWSDKMNSFNHYAYGAVGDWLYRKLAGLDVADDGAGYRNILIHPQPSPQFTYAKAHYHSVIGPIRSEWAHDVGARSMKITIEIPANTTATVWLPMAQAECVTESEHPLTEAAGILSVAQLETAVSVHIGSGHYVFTYPYNE